MVTFLDINKYKAMEQRLSFFFSNMQLQLQSLMETLSSTEPHYIRCVKPNNVLKPAIFENFNIIQQLRCGVSMSCPSHLRCASFILYHLRKNYHLESCSVGSFIQVINICYRVFLRRLGSAVLDTLPDVHFMSFLTALGF